MSVTIFTNGTVLNKNILEVLKDVHVEIVRTSIDGANAHEHDMVRGVKGAYDKTMKNIELLSDNGIPVQINTVIHKLNIKNANKIVKSLEGRGLSFRVDSYVPMRGPKNDPLFVSPHDFIKSVNFYNENRIDLDSISCFKNHRISIVVREIVTCSLNQMAMLCFAQPCRKNSVEEMFLKKNYQIYG